MQTESEYIFEDSNERFLEAEEIYALTEEEMRIARNEIYARLGRKFTDETLQEYLKVSHGTHQSMKQKNLIVWVMTYLMNMSLPIKIL